MISVEEARETILAKVVPLDVVEVTIADALGSILAEDVRSDIDIVPFDNSAMDGFALIAADVASAAQEAPVELAIIDHIGAGYHHEGTVTSGQAVRIMTGAPVPEGCDCVEMVEKVTFTGEGLPGDTLVISAPVKRGRNVRYAGEEARAGEVVMAAGQKVVPAAVGLLSSAGRATVQVYRRPRVGVISLGSELIDSTEVPTPGKLRDSNSYALAAQAVAAGCETIRYGIVPDDRDLIADTLSRAIDECDLVVSSGGASAGDYDYITQVASELGEVFFEYVNMRPGKSQTFAVIRDTPFLGLAGNPAAASVGFEMLARPALLRMQGHTDLLRPVQAAVLASDVHKKDSRRHYLRGSVASDGRGGLVATPAKDQSSALLGTLSAGNCLIVIPHDALQLAAGETVGCVRLDIDEGVVV